MKRMYYDELDMAKHIIYATFINPVLAHHNIVILYKEAEHEYIDVLVEYMNEKFNLPVLNLGELFTTGKVGPFSIDLDSISDSAVGVRRSLGKEMLS